LLVNKLGDTDRKVASRASYLLLQLENTHPSMKIIILNAVESDILLRSGQSTHAKYYAIITLNQTILQTSDPDVANKLLDIYFSLFVTSLNRSRQIKTVEPAVEDAAPEPPSKKRKRSATSGTDVNKAEQELEDKIIAQVLTGVNRAFPFTSKDSVVLEQHLETMYRITHSANFNTSIQALLLVQQISTAHHISTDRFMRTLYESLLDPRLLKSSKQTMYLNLLYRALKSDVSVRRVKAFVKRLLQVITLHDPGFVCGVLYLIVELQNVFPGVKAMLDQPEMQDDDEEEVFADAPEEGEEVEKDTAKPREALPSQDDALQASKIKPKSALIHTTAYDGRKRDPEHSNADRTCLWDLPTWSQHYHPSVSIFAAYLLSSAQSKSSTKKLAPPPKPDPQTHTLIHFLDRFAYRNPKLRENASLRGSSLMQPALASTNTADSLVRSTANAGKDAAVPLNNELFWARKVEDVSPDQVFFHKYFAEVGPRKAGRAEKKADKKRDEDEEDEDEELGGEQEIWKALVGSNAELADAEEDLDDDSSDGGLDMEEDEDDLVGSDDELLDLDDEEEGEDAAGSDDESSGFGDVDFEDGLLDGINLGDDDDAGSDEAGSDIDIDMADDGGLGDSSLFPAEEPEKPRKGRKKLPGKDAPDLESNRSRKRKRTLKSLPMFADASEYEQMLGDDEEGIDEG
jgi:ribosome biogenesis protein MAK21